VPKRRLVAPALLAALLLLAPSACASKAGRISVAPAGIERKWRLTQVMSNGKLTPIPPSITATIQFTADGHYLADDSANALDGTWKATSAGYRVTKFGSTLVGYAGTDATRLTAIAAIDSVTIYGADVAASSTGAQLTLTVSKYTLTFTDDGPATTFPPPRPTTTYTR